MLAAVKPKVFQIGSARFGLYEGDAAMRKRSVLASSATILTIILIATLLLGNGWLTGSSASAARASAKSAALAIARRGMTASDLQSLFFVWASGTPAVQRVAAQDCANLALSALQCARVSAATRTAWLDMAAQDPSALGRPNAGPNPAGRARVLAKLTASLTNATNNHVAPLLAATRTSLALVSQRTWMSTNSPCCIVAKRQVNLSGNAGVVLVWATSFTQTTLPGGLDPTHSPYIALPDAYLKYANWGQISNIPTIYRSYYAPTGATAHWTVNIQDGQGTHTISTVPITEVGPWNEDDNWWDPNGSSTTLPASCPVASPPAFPDATSNALVDGICPLGAAHVSLRRIDPGISTGNPRRIYYYLLHQHYGLPFFQSAGYKPSGSFADGSAWPSALPQYCSEAAAAAANSDGMSCYSGASSYNNANGGWLRDGTYDSGITNQSSIDLSPAVDNALGWVYPSSGLVLVTISSLP